MQEHFITLTDTIDMDLLVPYLYCQDVLTSYDVELFNYSGWESRKMKAIDLCHMITRRGPEAFKKFMLALSVLQPELFTLLCEGGTTAIGRELMELEQRFLAELDKDKRMLVYTDRTNQEQKSCDSGSKDKTIELPYSGTNQGPSQSAHSGANLEMRVDRELADDDELSKAGGRGCEVDIEKLSNTGKIAEKVTNGEVVEIHSTTGKTIDPVQNGEIVAVIQPLLTSTPKRLKLSPISPSNVADRGEGVVEVRQADEGYDVCGGEVVTCKTIDAGSKATKISRDIGPDQIRRDPRLARHEQCQAQQDRENDERALEPKTVYPLSVRKYLVPGTTRDGKKYVNIKAVRLPAQRRRAAIKIDSDQWALLTEFMDLIVSVQGLVAKERDVSLCIHLGDGIFIIVCPTYGNVEIRRYIPQGTNYLAIATSEGIVLSPREWQKLLNHRNKINQNHFENHFENEWEEGSHCWLAGRHEEFLGPLKCPDCGYVCNRGAWNIRYSHAK